MKLTYSQKRYIQQHYPTKTIEEIAQQKKIPTELIVNHIKRNKSLFKKPTNTKHVDLNNSKFKLQLPYLLLLAILVIIVYANGFTADFVSDDVYAILRNEENLNARNYIIIAPTFIVRAFLYWISYHIGGMTPFFFRFWNILFHIGFVWTTYLITPFFTKKKYVPFLAAAITAVHPMMIESVTWISGGIYSQAAFFTLLSFYFYLKNRRSQKLHLMLPSLILFLCALSVSEKVIIFPFVIGLYEFVYGSIIKRWKEIGSFFSISFLWGLIILGRIGERIAYLQTTQGPDPELTVVNPFIQIPIALGSYLKLFFWPNMLSLYQSEFRLNGGEMSILVFSTLLFISAVFVSFRKNKAIFFWLSFFIITLLPTLNPFGLSWIVAERYSYFGSIGLYIAFSIALSYFIEKKKYQMITYVFIAIILISLSVRTIVRNIDWKNEDNLWIATGRTSPSDPKTHNNLGDMHSRQGNFEKAKEEFGTAIQLNPNYADAYHNLGNVYQRIGSPSAALQLYVKAYELNPNLWQSLEQISILYFQHQEFETALQYMQQAIDVAPQNPALYINMGIMYSQLGDIDSARGLFNKALEIDPGNETAMQALNELSQ